MNKETQEIIDKAKQAIIENKQILFYVDNPQQIITATINIYSWIYQLITQLEKTHQINSATTSPKEIDYIIINKVNPYTNGVEYEEILRITWNKTIQEACEPKKPTDFVIYLSSNIPPSSLELAIVGEYKIAFYHTCDDLDEQLDMEKLAWKKIQRWKKHLNKHERVDYVVVNEPIPCRDGAITSENRVAIPLGHTLITG